MADRTRYAPHYHNSVAVYVKNDREADIITDILGDTSGTVRGNRCGARYLLATPGEGIFGWVYSDDLSWIEKYLGKNKVLNRRDDLRVKIRLTCGDVVVVSKKGVTWKEDTVRMKDVKEIIKAVEKMEGK